MKACTVTVALLLAGLCGNAASLASGGDTTVRSHNQQAFSQPAANMPMMRRLDFQVGNSFFRNPWVIAPASTTARDGLGPLFNTNGCQNCHIRDGRGHAPDANDINAVSMLLRLSIPADANTPTEVLQTLGVVPEPTYGDQLQDFAIPGITPEGQIEIRYETEHLTLHDGEKIELRRPRVSLRQLNYGALHENTLISARIAPPMIGLGLLQAIDEATLLSLADPDDIDGDGISGRPNRVWDRQQNRTVIGRFGWKAGQPTLLQQNSAAFAGDMGITSTQFNADACTAEQVHCLQAASGGTPEVADNIVEQVTFYTSNLAVPAQRDKENPQVQLGQRLFAETGCSGCHVSSLRTGDSEFPWLSQQTIAPYTDLLLHDMGDGLADNRTEFEANGREWRTPPLWGIGLTGVVAGKPNFLHDGRARNLLEAIAWHGGEAAAARQRALKLNKSERQALLAFLNSL